MAPFYANSDYNKELFDDIGSVGITRWRVRKTYRHPFRKRDNISYYPWWQRRQS